MQDQSLLHFEKNQRPLVQKKKKESKKQAQEFLAAEINRYLEKPDTGLNSTQKFELKMSKAMAASAFGIGLRCGFTKTLTWGMIELRNG